MNKLILMSGAALLTMSGMAIAQSSPAPDAAPDAATMPAAPNDATTATAPAAPPADAAPATAAADTTTAPSPNAAPADQVATNTAPAAPTAVNADAAAKVNADWAKYDVGNKGKLTPLEFGNWIKASQGEDKTAQVDKTEHSKASNLPAVKVLNETAGQFAKADTDHDKAISPNELAAFLSA